MLAARSGEIARSGDGDRPSGLELRDDRISEVSDRVREEDRLGPDADELSPLGESHEELAVEPEILLQRLRRRRLERLAPKLVARVRPGLLLRRGEGHHVPR